MMCNANCIRWVSKNLTKEEVQGKRVIDVGSSDENGSVRYVFEFLDPAEYVGVDIAEGPGVDLICSAENLVERFGEESFDIVVSTCALEHIRDWKTSISNLKNVCKPGGTLLIILPSSWAFHAYPHDYWRYGKEDMEDIFSDCDILVLEEKSQIPSYLSPIFSDFSLVYAKIRKPEAFVEKDLSACQLYSILLDKTVHEISDEDLQKSYARLSAKHYEYEIGKLIIRIGSSIQKFILRRLAMRLGSTHTKSGNDRTRD
jgi:SAM-dependent methyltransferase